MGRRACALLACLAVAALHLAAPSAFVPVPRSSSLIPAAVAGGSLAALPAWAYGPEALDAQLLLARLPGGKFTKEKQLVVPAPEDDGFSDAQVATCLVIALIAGLAALDLAKGMERGLRPMRSTDGKPKGNLTPLVKRFIEIGY